MQEAETQEVEVMDAADTQVQEQAKQEPKKRRGRARGMVFVTTKAIEDVKRVPARDIGVARKAVAGDDALPDGTYYAYRLIGTFEIKSEVKRVVR